MTENQPANNSHHSNNQNHLNHSNHTKQSKTNPSSHHSTHPSNQSPRETPSQTPPQSPHLPTAPHVWAIADLHLSFGTPDKGMEVFGEQWHNWTERTKENWCKKIKSTDLVLIPGDISWAHDPEQARPDLDWIDHLPGTKVMIKGNHDYWWQSRAKMKNILPSSIHILQNDVYNWNGISIGGTRLWDTNEYGFDGYIVMKPNERCHTLTEKDIDLGQMEKIYERELLRLEMSLKQLDPKAKIRIAMTHYPPIGADLAPSRVSQLLETYRVDFCVFGHLHNVTPGTLPFGKSRGVDYRLIAGDYLQFDPLLIV